MANHLRSDHARALIQTALESQVIKLRGASNVATPEMARENAEMDAEYLLTLYRLLQGPDRE